MKSYSDLQIIQGMRDKDPHVLRYLYDQYYPSVYNLIVSNSGSEAEVKDVFQETIILIYRKINDKSFQLSSTFKNYLLSVSWYIWVKELRTKNTEERIVNQYNYMNEDDDNLEMEYEIHKRYQIYQEHFNKLTKKCREILKLFFNKVPLPEIAERLGLKSEKSVKKRKFVCKENLIRSIKKDKRYPRYHE